MRVAHFSPLPPQQSGIADYCADLLPYLAQQVHLDAYADTADSTDDRFSVRPIHEFLEADGGRYQYDVCLYHMGNHPAYHEAIYTTLLRYPGVVVLHEINFHAFYLHRTLLPGIPRAAYVREMGYQYGLTGIREARDVLDGRHEAPTATYPLFRRLVQISLGIIVHTEYARDTLLAEVPGARVAYIPLGVKLPPTSPAADTDKGPELLTQFPPETILVGSFGYLAPSKRLDIVLQALAQLRGSAPDFRYLLVGEPIVGYDITEQIRKFNLEDVVYQTGFVDESSFTAFLKQVDIGINLRSRPTGGEMSATLLRLLAQGQAVIVSNVDGFASLPDEVVLKIDQNDNEVEQLTETLHRLLTDETVRTAYGRAARAYIQRQYSFPQVAAQYVTFMQACIQSPPVIINP